MTHQMESVSVEEIRRWRVDRETLRYRKARDSRLTDVEMNERSRAREIERITFRVKAWHTRLFDADSEENRRACELDTIFADHVRIPRDRLLAWRDLKIATEKGEAASKGEEPRYFDEDWEYGEVRREKFLEARWEMETPLIANISVVLRHEVVPGVKWHEDVPTFRAAMKNALATDLPLYLPMPTLHHQISPTEVKIALKELHKAAVKYRAALVAAYPAFMQHHGYNELSALEKFTDASPIHDDGLSRYNEIYHSMKRSADAAVWLSDADPEGGKSHDHARIHAAAWIAAYLEHWSGEAPQKDKNGTFSTLVTALLMHLGIGGDNQEGINNIAAIGHVVDLHVQGVDLEIGKIMKIKQNR